MMLRKDLTCSCCLVKVCTYTHRILMLQSRSRQSTGNNRTVHTLILECHGQHPSGEVLVDIVTGEGDVKWCDRVHGEEAMRKEHTRTKSWGQRPSSL